MSEEYLYRVESGVEIPPKPKPKKKVNWRSIADRMKHMDCIPNLSWDESQSLSRAIRNNYLATIRRPQDKFKYTVWKIKKGEQIKIIL